MSCVGIVEVVVAADDEWPKMSVVQEGRSCSLPFLSFLGYSLGDDDSCFVGISAVVTIIIIPYGDDEERDVDSETRNFSIFLSFSKLSYSSFFLTLSFS